MNPYLDMLKSEKGVPQALPKLTEAPFVSSVSDMGRSIPEIDTPSVSSVSGVGTPFLKIDLVQEFMEVDGMTREDATVLAAQCHAPRRAAEWLSMVVELDNLISAACQRFSLSPEALQRVMAVRRCQSLASIPTTLQWFRDELKGDTP